MIEQNKNKNKFLKYKNAQYTENQFNLLKS